jgi:hypothetical protein
VFARRGVNAGSRHSCELLACVDLRSTKFCSFSRVIRPRKTQRPVPCFGSVAPLPDVLPLVPLVLEPEVVPDPVLPVVEPVLEPAPEPVEPVPLLGAVDPESELPRVVSLPQPEKPRASVERARAAVMLKVR